MGSAVSAIGAPAPSESPFDPIVERTSGVSSSSISPYHISSSFLYCIAQHAAAWPDYYTILDIRNKAAYQKAHIRGSLWIGDVQSSFAEHLQGLIVAVVDHRQDSDGVKTLLKQLDKQVVCPATLYLLNEPFSTFKSKYYFVLSNFAATKGQLPGPVEYVPRTKSTPAIYGLQNVRYSGCKSLVAYLGCTKVINLSATRLAVSVSDVAIENVCFDGVHEPYEHAVAALFNFAREKGSGWRGNILIIDEKGCHYSALITGWYLIENCLQDVESVCQHMANKSADLDPWYMSTLQHWASSRRIERDPFEHEDG